VTAEENVAPVITGQEQLNVDPGETLSIELAHLHVDDPDNTYPDDFSLNVFPGNNYSASSNVITPANTFTGTLSVPVTVNDGESNSEQFVLEVVVAQQGNSVPQITGQDELSTTEDTSITLKFGDLNVTDSDDNYPTGFTMKVSDGANYSVSGLTITPDGNFNGTLTVPVQVNDGTADSEPFNVTIAVTPVNDAPVITGQSPLSTDVNTPTVLNIMDLKVSDPDNNFPEGFSFAIRAGNNYSVSGSMISPFPDFEGTLTVNVTVSDGTSTSQPYPLKVEVSRTASNTPPVITGQKIITMVEKSSLSIAFSHLFVTDPDSRYPSDFTLKVFPGDNYTVKGNTITPLPTFTNNSLSVQVMVNDGVDDSNPYELKIQIIPSSSTPIINGQKEITIDEDGSIEITLGHLEVTDTDNVGYPKGFSLAVLPGDGTLYQVSGNTVTPIPDLNGFIDVGVTVSDGVNTSAEFRLSILITPVNDAPQILNVDSALVGYEPGGNPVDIFPDAELRDVDNEYLSMAEVGFRDRNFSPANDELLFTNDSSTIKAIYDPEGVLFLVGYAPIEDYRKLINSIQYRYNMTLDASGNPTEILSGQRTIFVSIHDGQLSSDTLERKISMETKVTLDIPNTFTPNGDQSNDTWHIHAPDVTQVKDAVIRVYNKRGNLIFETKGLERDWDGSSNGQHLPVDTYYYIIDLNLPYMKQTYKGYVTILR
jgi:gliding motility-associated-like protein